jgi:ribulose-phosphate 3-epimerase
MLAERLLMADRFDRVEIMKALRAARPVVLPSLLACDFGHLHDEVKAVERAGAVALHLDVMDGRFVPNISFGLPIVEAVRKATKLPLDVHLMIEEPARYIGEFRAAGADLMTIHVEAVDDPRPVLDEIRGLGAVAGLAINPPTPLETIEASLPHCDMVLVMSVMPGFGGQEFDAVALDKLQKLRARVDVDALLEVDGGIATDTIGQVTHAGAELLVAGTAIFRHDDYTQAIGELRTAAMN